MSHWWDSRLAAWGTTLVLLAIGGAFSYLKPAVGIPMLVVLFLVGVCLVVRAYTKHGATTRAASRQDAITVETRPVQRNDWAHIVVKNTGNKTASYSARVTGIAYDKRDVFPKSEETPYDISWRDSTDSSNWRRIAGGGGESILNVALSERPVGIPDDPNTTVVRLYSTTAPGGFTRVLQFNGCHSLDVVLSIEIFADPKLELRCVHDYVLTVNDSRRIERFERRDLPVLK